MPRIPERRRGRSDDALREIWQELERAWLEEHTAAGDILLVDCVPDERDAYVDYLKRAGLEPVVDCDAQSAFATAVAVRPRIVIVDSVLGEASGFELVRKLRGHAETRDALIVVLTRDGSEECATAARRAGADVRVIKPCPPEQVASAIVQYLRQPTPTDESPRRVSHPA